jgi:hypothetical protein
MEYENNICINIGCNNKRATNGKGKSRPTCSRCHKANYGEGTYAKGVIVVKKDYCENVDGHLGFPCKIPGVLPSRQLDIDHIIPEANDGPNTPENTETLCKYCHVEKTYTEQYDKPKITKNNVKNNTHKGVNMSSYTKLDLYVINSYVKDSDSQKLNKFMSLRTAGNGGTSSIKTTSERLAERKKSLSTCKHISATSKPLVTLDSVAKATLKEKADKKPNMGNTLAGKLGTALLSNLDEVYLDCEPISLASMNYPTMKTSVQITESFAKELISTF